MFDDRSTRFPRAPGADFADYIERFLRKGDDETGALRYLDDIVSENRYTNPDFDDLVERVFDAAEFLFNETREFQNVGKAVLTTVIIYARWLMERDNPREVDELRSREYDTLKDSAANYDKIVRELDGDRRGGRDSRGRRDDRDDRRRDDRDRGRSRRDDRDDDRRSRRDRDDRGRRDDPREERRRDARRDDDRRRDDERRDRRDERRNDDRRSDERRETRRDTPARAPAAKSNVGRMTDAQRALRLGAWRMEIFKHRQRKGLPQDPAVTAEELESLGINAEDFVAVGGEVADTQKAPTAVEVQPPVAQRQHVTEMPRKEPAMPEPVAFEEVFTETNRPVKMKEPLTPAEEAALLPQIDPSIDYNRYVTSNDIVYATGQERPKSDPVVPTLRQWVAGGWSIDNREFIEQLPSLPAIRGFGEHLPSLYEVENWVPFISPTEDGYKMLAFRERDVNKDDIMIPNLGSVRRTGRVANPVGEAVAKSTRYNALQMSAEVKAATLRHDEATAQWVDDGSDPATAPVPEHIPTERKGQLVNIPYTIHATSLTDAVVKMHAALGGMGVGLDETANVACTVAIHTLLGVATNDDDFGLMQKYLETFTPDGSGAHLMLPHLWQEFQNARSYVPEHIWLRINLLFTDIINEVLANNLCLPTRIESFEAEGRQLLDNLADAHGRYMAEKLSLNAVEVSKRLRCLSFVQDENVGTIPRGIWAIERRTVLYANAMLNEFGMAVFNYGDRSVNPDRNRTTHYVVRPEQNPGISAIVERLQLDASNADKSLPVNIVTLDDYSCVLESNWLSQGTYYTMALTHL